MRLPRLFSGFLLVAAVALLPACSQPAGGDASPEADGEPASTSTAAVTGGRPDPAGAEPRPVLAGQDVRLDSVDLHVAVHELARRGKLVELTFSVARTDDGDENWQIAGTFGGTTQSKSTNSVSGVELLDTANGKLHTVALDPEGNCACSGGTASTFLAAGDTVLFSATYAAPPDTVQAMGVRIPTVGTFNDVPLS